MLGAMDTAEALELALELADRADRITMDRFRAHDLKVTTKPDLTPVSEADEAVERAIRERLAAATGHVVLGEEFGTDAGTGDDSEYRWIIDPIDGTKNYVRGVPIWATLDRARTFGRDDRRRRVGTRARDAVVGGPRAGCVPRRRAHHGLVGRRPRRRAPLVRLGHLGSLPRRRHRPKLVDLSHRCWRTRGIGDFWQHLLVAEGAFDVAIDPIVSLWDIAALVPIVEEAGGRWTGVDGNTGIDAGSFVCTNGLLHDAVIASLA